ncbi:MAG: hypothetical protein A4E19_09155 [Nitrospira sp. SG-bin1]|nr:MAG: hypothetical protein A4E19_09155 [Nitrospira sp. SG-bin1]
MGHRDADGRNRDHRVHRRTCSSTLQEAPTNPQAGPTDRPYVQPNPRPPRKTTKFSTAQFHIADTSQPEARSSIAEKRTVSGSTVTPSSARPHIHRSAWLTAPFSSLISNRAFLTSHHDKLIRMKSGKADRANVYPIGVITKGSVGRELTDFRALKEAGCVAV